MPKKRKATVARLVTLAALRDALSVKQKKSIGGDSDLSDGNEEMTSDDDHVHLRSCKEISIKLLDNDIDGDRVQ